MVSGSGLHLQTQERGPNVIQGSLNGTFNWAQAHRLCRVCVPMTNTSLPILPSSRLTSNTCPSGHLPSASKSSPGTRILSPQALQQPALATTLGFLPYLPHSPPEWLRRARGEVNSWLYHQLAETT